MDLDEYIFEKITKYFKKRSKTATKENRHRVTLEEIRPRLTLMARALTGLPIEVFPAEREGGYKNYNFFLPSSVTLFTTADENLSFYFYRIVYLAVQQRLDLNWHDTSPPPLLAPQSMAINTAAQVLKVISEEYPIVFELHNHFKQKIENTLSGTETPPDFTWLYGKWMKNADRINKNNLLGNFVETLKPTTHQQPTTTLKAKAIEEIRSIEIDKKQQEDYVLTHNFEKAETAEEFDGTWRDFDGDDELEKHQDALDELNMKFTVRVDDTAHSVYQAEFIENTSISESQEKRQAGSFIAYPEWDYSKRLYRENFCKVFPQIQSDKNINYYNTTIHTYRALLMGLRKMLTNVNNKLNQQRRQTEGCEFDLDAITDLYVDVHAQRTPSEKIYLAHRKRDKDLAVLLLLDTSLSSDGYVAGNRVIDIEKQMSILFGEILHEFQIDFSIASFFSKTRNYLAYNVLKDFDEKWSEAKYKIGATEPCGYTRIGAALRHAGQELKKRSAKRKWIILLSDGKPNDFDRYEGKHGVNDVKKALHELDQSHINSYALAIEAQARYYLPQMFGQNHYRILTNPNDLLKSLVGLFEKIRN